MKDESIKKDIPIKEGDYIIAKENMQDIMKMSVGLVEEIKEDIYTIFFIGKRERITTNSKNITFLDISLTGKPFELKICNICHVLKNRLKDFEPNQNDKKGRTTTRPSCRICRKNIDKEKFLLSEKKKMEENEPKGIFICPLCEKISIPFKTANIVKDHDHDTGKAREWICDSCNTGLGRFKDNIEVLEKAIKYLKKYS